MQTSKSVLGFFFVLVFRDKYLIMLYISLVIYLTLAKLTEQWNVS